MTLWRAFTRHGKPAFAGVLVLMFIAPALAQDAPGRDKAEKLDAEHEKVEEQASALRKDSAKIRVEITSLQQQLISLAAKMAVFRQEWDETEQKLETLGFEETAILGKLDAERAVLMDFLAALQRAQMSHPPAIIVSPDDITTAARAALLLTSAAPELKSRADQLSKTLSTLGAVRAETSKQQIRLKAQEAALKKSTSSLQSLLNKRRKLELLLRHDANKAAEQAQRLAARASTLRELIEQLEASASRFAPRHKPPRGRFLERSKDAGPRRKPDPQTIPPLAPFIAPTGRFADSRGLLRLPVKGSIAHAFGQALDKPRRSGLVIHARRGAQVTAPFDAQILYSGMFRNFGRLLILNVGEGYLIIIAGLERSFVVPDQLVLAGEPVGELSSRSRPTPELYLEFQKNGRPIDPVPWLTKGSNGG